MSSEDELLDVAIIGAGLSGLAAARELTMQGCWRFKIFEASDRVGGRTFVDEEGTDLGGAYFGPGQDRIISIIDEFSLKLRKVQMAGKTVQFLNGRSERYEGTIPPVGVLGALDLNNAMIKIDDLCAEINLAQPHLSTDAAWLDAITADELLRKYCVTKSARKIMRTAVRAILCTEACTISALFLVWYIAQSGGCQRTFETDNGAQDSKVVGGAGRIAQLLADKYAPHDVLVLNSPIRSVNYEAANEVVLRGDDELKVRAKAVIFAIPPVQMLRLQYTPSLDGKRFQSLQRWPLGCIIKTVMYYGRRFWKDSAANLNGTIVADGGIVCVCYDDTDEDGHFPAIMGFCLSTESLKEQSQEARKKEICEHYAQVFGMREFLSPVRYKEKNWQDEPWVGGCYVGAVGPGMLTSFGLAHCAPIDKRIFIAGTESARRNIGYMDGAVEAGERAARDALVSLQLVSKDQYNIVSSPGPSVQMPLMPLEYSWVERHLPSVHVVLWGGAAVVVGTVVFLNCWLRNL